MNTPGSAPQAVVTGSFDDLRSNHLRFLQEASRFGRLHVLLWSDETIRQLEGNPPKFPEAERQYLLAAIRCVHRVEIVKRISDPHVLPIVPQFEPDIWVVTEPQHHPQKQAYCEARQIQYRVLASEQLKGFPDWIEPSDIPVQPETVASTKRKKVIVTGCYDWFHSGHVRFFEEIADLGELYVVVGHDANVRSLKGEGHPLFPQEERRYMVQCVRFVKRALVSTGQGWLDAEPEILRIKPDIYAVNEDGDRPVKREYCEKHGIEYRVLKRVPKAGLPRRQSTNLRGF